MAEKEKRNPLGPTGETVRANLKRLRVNVRNLGYTQLSRKLDEVGRPIPDLGLRRIESGDRRVDADDLVALALALGVSPLALLLPTEASSLVPEGDRYPVGRIWEWAKGQRPLSGDVLTFKRDSNPLDWDRWEAEAASRGLDEDEAAQVAAYRLRMDARKQRLDTEAGFGDAGSDRERVLIEFTQDTDMHLRGDRLRVDPGSAVSFVDQQRVAKRVSDGDD
jgi:transcriptional regulator with XRE-family HTH domain